MLEVLGQQVPGEVRRVPDDEAGAAGAPGDDAVGGRVLHHLVGLDQERRRAALRVGSLHAPNEPGSSPAAAATTAGSGQNGWDLLRLAAVREESLDNRCQIGAYPSSHEQAAGGGKFSPIGQIYGSWQVAWRPEGSRVAPPVEAPRWSAFI